MKKNINNKEKEKTSEIKQKTPSYNKNKFYYKSKNVRKFRYQRKFINK